jgi:hypothetical protein
MGSKGFILRMLPFVTTFAVGLFIASFFVSVGSPGFNGRRGKFHEMKRLRIENEELRNENLRLKNELEDLRWNSGEMNHDHEAWHSPERRLPVIPPPPPAPVAPRSIR